MILISDVFHMCHYAEHIQTNVLENACMIHRPIVNNEI